MEINIKVSEGSTANAIVTGNDAPGTINAANNGGASPTGDNKGNADVSANGQLDIGGPPQWLSDAIGNKNAGSDTSSANTFASSTGETTDAGTAPNFN